MIISEVVNQNLVPNPFPKSQIQQPVFHGSVYSDIDKFKRPPHGFFVSRYEDYATEIYGDNVYVLYINVQKILDIDRRREEIEWIFDREYEKIAEWLKKLKSEGYDAIEIGGDGNSLLLTDDVEIVNAKTGERM